jgi:hypothetical protein
MLDGGRSNSDRCVVAVTNGRNGSLRENRGAGDTGQSAWIAPASRPGGCGPHQDVDEAQSADSSARPPSLTTTSSGDSLPAVAIRRHLPHLHQVGAGIQVRRAGTGAT